MISIGLNKERRQSTRQTISFLLVCLTISILTLSACKPKTEETLLEPVLIATFAPTAQTYPTMAITAGANTLIDPSPTETLMPATQADAAANNAGVILFSMMDGTHKHLFAYHPSYLAITRLTADAWDDESPVVSPDGNKIAYTSTRTGNRDIFIWDLPGNTLRQITNTTDSEGSISWSPDGAYITYSFFQGDHFDLKIQSTLDANEAVIQFTEGGSNNDQPAWSPAGDEIAFVTNRSGRDEIWIARLQNLEERFVKVIGSANADYSHPVWSPDGNWLAVQKHQNSDEVLLISPHDAQRPPIYIGVGAQPVWLPDGSGLFSSLVLANQNQVLAYSINDRRLILPPIPLAGSLSGYDWKAGNLSNNIQMWKSQNALNEPASLWMDTITTEPSENGRRGLVTVENVETSDPLLSDAVDDSFNALRATVKERTGWDVLAILDNATLALTGSPLPGIPQNWLYTGRAIALNLAPYEAGWMVVNREDITGEIYWRVWVKCKIQDGTCGEPVDGNIWDFNSRTSGDAVAYEDGGKILPPPDGYWVDFTALAIQYGWERLPALNNWRTYIHGTQFNVFALKQDLSWQNALLEIYPPEQVSLFSGETQ